MATIDATVAGANANSYATIAEANAYFESRLALASPWEDYSDDEKTRLLIMAARLLDAMAQPVKTLIARNGSDYYRVRPQWTGAAATTTQVMAWPRTGMFDQNGNEILSTIIPQTLKNVQSEFAGQLGLGDRSLDNPVIVQGLTSLKAGSVSLSFKDSIMPQVIPDAVYNLMPISWLTEELYEPAQRAEFGVI
jgi:hypothetical protein